MHKQFLIVVLPWQIVLVSSMGQWGQSVVFKQEMCFLWEFKRRILMQSWSRLTDNVILYWYFLHIREEAWFRHACRLRTAQIYFFHQRGPSLFVWRFCLPLRVHLQTPFCIVAPNPLMEEYNRSMSSDRISVGWIFGVISNYFKFVDLKKNLKMTLSPVGKM